MTGDTDMTLEMVRQVGEYLAIAAMRRGEPIRRRVTY